MARKSSLQVGDTFVTGIGEVYTYLGYFKGKPRSYYSVAEQGHLYVYVGSKPITNVCELENNIDVRARYGLDGNFSYTKSPKRFVDKLGNVPIRQRDYILGLKRVENKN